jgi:two-component system phosphate regulon sensor histidine kinase PhoR
MKSRQIAQLSTSEVSEAALCTALDVIVRESLRPFAAGLSALYAVFAVSHGLLLPEAVGALMIPVATGTAALLLGLYRGLGWWAIPSRWAHPLAAGIAGLVLLNSLLHLFLLSDPQQTLNLMLLAVGVGCFFLSTPWLSLVLAATIGGWGLVVWGAAPSPAWLHFGFGLVSASVLSGVVHTVRVRTFRHLERLRLQDAHRKRELEEAVQVQHQSEQALREREEKLAAIIGTASDAILTLDLAGVITSINPAGEVLLGYCQGELRGQPLEQFLTAASATLARERTTKALRREPLPSLFELDVLRPDGSLVPVEAKARFLRAAGTPVGLVCIFRDAREKKALERQRAEFLAMLTHDIKNPLGVIVGYCDMLLDPTAGRSAPAQTTLLQRLRSNALTIHSLITNYLNLSKIEAGHLTLAKQPLVLNELLRQVGQQYEAEAQRRGLRLQLCLQEELPPIEGDPLALARVVANLLHNALKFTPESGQITVSSAYRDGEVVAAVANTGLGIAPTELPRLFEKYRRAAAALGQEGMGLGLYIVKMLVDAHGGRIEVRSTPGQRTCFSVFLRAGISSPPATP